MIVSIDPSAGFCFGVAKAIDAAVEMAENGESIATLGDIVHNEEEISRLKSLGVTCVNYKGLEEMKGGKVLIRAHGEPPATYKIAKENDIELVDQTCPIVRKLQERVRKSAEEMSEKNGQLVIFGKDDHPEVKALVGFSGGKAIVVGSDDDLDKIDMSRPVRLYSQTTKNIADFDKIVNGIKDRLSNGSQYFKFYNTICGKVSGRVPELQEFASENDVVIFVSGKKSSNGKSLFEVCKAVNENSYFVSSGGETTG